VVLALVVSFLVLMVLIVNGGRGFLPQARRTIWLEARPLADKDAAGVPGGWGVLQIAEGDSEPAQNRAGGVQGVRLRVEEFSMGRTDTSGWSEWRASDWIVADANDAGNRWEDWGELGRRYPPTLRTAVNEYIEETVIPNSPALAVWPGAARSLTPRDGARWIVWQRRFNASACAATLLFCGAVGFVTAFLVLPPRGRAATDRLREP
jgi:hypothetical protein